MNPAPAAAVQRPATLPAPKFRAQAPDEPEPPARPAFLQLPSPEQLGVGRPHSAPATVDWNKAYHELDKLGAIGIQREHLPAGSYRIGCLLPTGQPDR